jgi:hypothetical protein
VLSSRGVVHVCWYFAAKSEQCVVSLLVLYTVTMPRPPPSHCNMCPLLTPSTSSGLGYLLQWVKQQYVPVTRQKVTLSLCFFNWKPFHEGVLGVEVQLHTFSTSALGGGEWSASCLGSFTPRGRASGTHWIGGRVGPRDGLDAVMKRKIVSPCRDSNHRSLSYDSLISTLNVLRTIIITLTYSIPTGPVSFVWISKQPDSNLHWITIFQTLNWIIRKTEFGDSFCKQWLRVAQSL